MPFERGGTKWAKKILAMESVNSLRISAPQWRPLREGRDGKCEERNEKCEFLARESVSSSPIVRIFGKGKCKFIANFSATMVTSLPSLSLSVCGCVYTYPDIRMSELRIGLPSTRKRLKCTLSGAVRKRFQRWIIRMSRCSLDTCRRGIRVSGCHCACALRFPWT